MCHSTDNPPPKVVQGYKVRSHKNSSRAKLGTHSWRSSMSFTRTSSTNQKRQRTRLSRSRGTTRPCFCTLVLVLRMRTSLSELSIVNGNSRTSGALLVALPYNTHTNWSCVVDSEVASTGAACHYGSISGVMYVNIPDFCR